jgi:hypothetical protein
MKKILLLIFITVNYYSQVLEPIYVDSNSKVQFTSSNLPIFVINTNGQTIIDEQKITADLGVIYNGEGVRNYITDPFNHYNGKIGIEIRGSSTQMFPKKQYSVETRDLSGNDLDVSLLGFPAESDWIFYAPYTDKSLMRNFLAYSLARTMGKYATRCKYFELVINNDYKGVYILLEKIKRDKNRVNIKKIEPTDITGDAVTGGYIIKIDKWTGEGNDGWTSNFLPYANAWQRVSYQYHIPKPEDIVPQQKTYIQNYMFNFESKMYANNFNNPDSGYSKFVDVSSFVDMFLINEMSKNVDGYRLSTFMYKDRNSVSNKLVMGPIWDYNLAFGNADYYEGAILTGWMLDYLSTNQFFLQSDMAVPPFWWKKIKDDTYFQNQVKTRWEYIKTKGIKFEWFNNKIDSLVVYLNESQQRNFQRWPVLGVYVWPNAYIGQSYTDEILYLKAWIRDRLNWIDSNLPGQVVSVDEEILPTEFSLKQNFPNPFNPATTISYSIRENCLVNLEIYNQLGEKIKTVYEGERSNGVYFENVDLSGYSSGIYFYRLNITLGSKNLTETKKMLLLK